MCLGTSYKLRELTYWYPDMWDKKKTLSAKAMQSSADKSNQLCIIVTGCSAVKEIKCFYK